MFKKSLHLLKKVSAVAILVAVLLSVSSQSAQAFYTPNASYMFQFWNAVFKTDEMNLQSFVYETYKATVMSVITPIMGCWTCGFPPQKVPWFGALGITSQFMAMMYDNQPASGVQYLAYLGKKLDIVPETYAQADDGFGRLPSLLPIWQRFRDITYVLFVLVIIASGFAIMFRVKISPQAVITVQSALPRIALALIMITFSYAIVGLMIDLMLVLINLSISVLGNLEGVPEFVQSRLQPFPAVKDTTIGRIMLEIGLLPILSGIFVLGIILGIANIFTAGGGGVMAIGSIVILLFMVIVCLIALIKVAWSLLKSYINVVLALIFGPFQLLLGALPGSKSIGNWFRNLLANLAVFPTTFIMVFIAGYLTLGSWSQVIQGFIANLFDPETALSAQEIGGRINDIAGQIEGQAPTLTATTVIMFFISLGIILMTPKVADMIQAFLAGKPMGAGAAIGEAMAAGGITGFAMDTGKKGMAEQLSQRYGPKLLGWINPKKAV